MLVTDYVSGTCRSRMAVRFSSCPVFIIDMSLWHNSLITISIFHEFWSKTIHEDYNFFEICCRKLGGGSF